MAKLLYGDGNIKIKKKAPARTKTLPPDEHFNQFLEEHLNNKKLREVYRRFETEHGALSRTERVNKLEELLTQGGEFYNLLSEPQQESLGFLTTVYALHRFAPKEGNELKIENLDFLAGVNLGNADYLLAGLNRAEVETISSAGGCCLTEAENVKVGVIGHIEQDKTDGKIRKSGPFRFAPSSRKVKVGLVKYCGKYFGDESKEMEVGRVHSTGEYFGKNSEKMKVGTVEICGQCLGYGSSMMEVEVIDFGKDCSSVGQRSKNLKVDKINGVTMSSSPAIGENSENMIIGEVENTGFYFGKDSTGMRVGEVKNTGDRFGTGSTNLEVRTVVKSGDSFGYKSKQMNVGEIGETESQFGEESEQLRVKVIGKCSLYRFGLKSKNLRVEEIGVMEGRGKGGNETEEDYCRRMELLKESSDTLILNLRESTVNPEKVLIHPMSRYIVVEQRDGKTKIHSDLGPTALEILQKESGPEGKHNYSPLLKMIAPIGEQSENKYLIIV